MRRGDVAVISISAALGAVVVAGIVFSVLVVDRPRPSDKVAANSDSSLFVVTWAPSLCKVEPSNPGCRSGHVGKLGPTLILHGLWPQPPTEQYCGVPKGRDQTLNLPQDVQANLQSKMSDVSMMAPHEWNAHGTCSGVAPAEYFSIAATLTDQVTALLDPVFEKAQGGYVTLSAVRDRFDAEFGAGAGNRVGMNCRKAEGVGMVAYEVNLSLPPVVDLKAAQGNLSLKDVITKGPTIFAGCRRGSVP